MRTSRAEFSGRFSSVAQFSVSQVAHARVDQDREFLPIRTGSTMERRPPDEDVTLESGTNPKSLFKRFLTIIDTVASDG